MSGVTPRQSAMPVQDHKRDRPELLRWVNALHRRHGMFIAACAILIIAIYTAGNTPSAREFRSISLTPGDLEPGRERPHSEATASLRQTDMNIDSASGETVLLASADSTIEYAAYRRMADESVIDNIDQADGEAANGLEDTGEESTATLTGDNPRKVVTVRERDTLSQIFSRHGLDTRTAFQIAALESAKPLLKIRPGQEIHFELDGSGQLQSLVYPMGRFNLLRIHKKPEGYEVEDIYREPEIRINNAQATISKSLLNAASESGIPLAIMYKFIDIFKWQIDFSMDIQEGDRFSVIYEEQFIDGEKIGDGDIIAAELNARDKKYQAIRHIDDENHIEYFAPNGEGIRSTFLRSPLKFSHVSSGFSPNRLHPIKKVWRAHKGVDYAAPQGTPIMATGDGVVKTAQTRGGYGKTVIIRHHGKYETLYAHLSGYAKGIKSGARVRQGSVIGYIGQTGMATGPHLHYEFRIDGVHKNPVTVELPKSPPIDEAYLARFEHAASIWAAELDHLNEIALARLDPQ